MDVYIPGARQRLPPRCTACDSARPAGKIHARGPVEDEQPAGFSWRYGAAAAREVDREARRLAGYRYGRQIADDF